MKAFPCTKDGRGAYNACITNHAGDTKYRAIYKKRMNLLQRIKWNGRAYALEAHVSNNRQAVDDIREYLENITVPVPDGAQRVEYLIDIINCSDSVLQAALGLVRANTNSMKTDFEQTGSTLIEVDPYGCSQLQHNPEKGEGQMFPKLTAVRKGDLQMSTSGGITPRNSKLYQVSTRMSCVLGRRLLKGRRFWMNQGLLRQRRESTRSKVTVAIVSLSSRGLGRKS